MWDALCVSRQHGSNIFRGAIFISGISFAALKFQQYISHNPNNPNEGRGIFGQIGIGDGNLNRLDNHYVLGPAGTSPIIGRAVDRWVIAWAYFDWSDGLVRALEAGGGGLNDEWAVAAFYEAEITPNFRVGGNVVRVSPGSLGIDAFTQFGI